MMDGSDTDESMSDSIPLYGKSSDTSRGTLDSAVLTVTSLDAKEGLMNRNPDSMSEDPRLEEAFALIREALADTAENAVKAFITNLQSAPATQASTSKVTRHPDADVSRRAPAGSARVLCKRALSEVGNSGLTIAKILGMAMGQYEKMLTASALRNELNVGSTNLDPPLYERAGGVWYLAGNAPRNLG